MFKITIAGVDYPINLGTAALAEILDDLGLSLSELEKVTSITLIQAAKILHRGMAHQARVNKQQFSATWYDVCDLIDQDPSPMQVLVKVLEAFTASISEKSAIADSENNEDAEKKST